LKNQKKEKHTVHILPQKEEVFMVVEDANLTRAFKVFGLNF
jgi:hypothetical protein